MLRFGSQRSPPAVEGNGFFQAHFSAAVGELNNTKSVSFTLEGDRTREIYRFLKRTVPIKRLDFLTAAQENGLIRHQTTAFRPFMQVCRWFAVKSVMGSFSHGVFLAQSKQAKLRPGKSFDGDLAICFWLNHPLAMIDVNAHQNAKSSMYELRQLEVRGNCK